MFTGIIEALGTIQKLDNRGKDIRLTVSSKHLDMSDAKDRKWLIDEMDKFFNNEDYEQASGFKALT